MFIPKIATCCLGEFFFFQLHLFTFAYGEGHGDHSVSSRNSIQATYEVRQVVQDAQIVLDHDDESEFEKKKL
jgi:hypothetical protein